MCCGVGVCASLCILRCRLSPTVSALLTDGFSWILLGTGNIIPVLWYACNLTLSSHFEFNTGALKVTRGCSSAICEQLSTFHTLVVFDLHWRENPAPVAQSRPTTFPCTSCAPFCFPVLEFSSSRSQRAQLAFQKGSLWPDCTLSRARLPHGHGGLTAICDPTGR